MMSAVFLMLAACGQSFVGLGIYTVDIKYLRDDWPGGEAGKETTAQWVLEESDETYTLTVRGTPSVYTGQRTGDFLFFDKTTDSKAPSCFKHVVNIKMYPEKDERRVRGIGEMVTFVDCDSNKLIVQITFQGYLTEEF